MNRFINKNIAILRHNIFAGAAALALVFASAAIGQVRPYRVNDTMVQNLLNRIETKSDTFHRQIDQSLDNSRYDGTQREDSISRLVENFENATDVLKRNFDSKVSVSRDVENVLYRAVFINNFMTRNRMSPASERNWADIRADLTTLAGYYNVTTDWSATSGYPVTPGHGYYVTDQEMRVLLSRLQIRESTFSRNYDRWSRSYGRKPATTDETRAYLTQLDRGLDVLNRDYNRVGASTDVRDILIPATYIKQFIATNRTPAYLTTSWRQLENDLETLSNYYRVSWNWNDTNLPGSYPGTYDRSLTGTFRLNSSLSENVATEVNQAVINANYNSNIRDRVRRNLERRLASPLTLMIERKGDQVMMSSTGSETVTLTADGVTRTETLDNGRTMSVTATTTGNGLTVDYNGDRTRDFYVTFMPQANGQLRVTRRIYLENKNETVSVTSVYDKIDRTPNWNNTGIVVNDPYGKPMNGYLIANDTDIIATLNTPLSTKTARDGDRFAMTIKSPSRYSGAVIEGRVVGERSGLISGRAKLSLDFETLRMPDGRLYAFSGIVDQVRETDGDLVDVDNEGQIRDDSQTKKTITRAGIGAVLGAVIGAITSGGDGAAIGAGIGAGAGAGTVVLQGKDNLELEAGSQFMITATAPSNVATR